MSKIVFDIQRFDNISNSANNTIVDGTNGNDSIENTGDNVSIFAYRGDDTIIFNDMTYHEYIEAGSGNDIIIHSERFAHPTIYGGDGDDTMSFASYEGQIYGEKGNDTFSLLSGQWYATLDGGADNDLFYIYSAENIIYGGTGNDTIYNYNTETSGNTLYGGDGNDLIILAADSNQATANGGAGNDTISLHSDSANNVIQFEGGNDVIKGLTDDDTVQVISNVVSKVSVSGNDVYIYSGNDYITAKDMAKKSVNVLTYSGSINAGGEYGNKINIMGSNNTIYGNSDNDSLFIDSSSSSSINGQAGNDYIELSSNSNNCTITGGGGNDTIVLNSMNNIVQHSSGNLVIQGFNASDTLQISASSIKKAGWSGDDAIIYVGNNYLVLKDRAEVRLKLQLAGGNVLETIFSDEIDAPPKSDVISNSDNNTEVSGTSSADTITNSGANVTINGGAGNDKITNSGSKVIINGDVGEDSITNSGANVTIVGGAGNDRISLSSAATGNLIKYASGDGNDTVYGVDSNDTLQITGAKYSTVKSGNDLVVSVGSGSVILQDAADTSIKINGTLAGGEDTGGGGSDTTPAEDLPAGWKFTSTLATATLATADDLDLTQDYGANIKNVNASITSGGVVIVANSLNNSIRAGKGDDLIYDGGGNDTVSLGAGNDTYIYTSGNDLIQDYTAGQDKIKFETEIENASVSGSNLIITTGEGNVTVKNGKNKNISVIDSSNNSFEIYNEYPVPGSTLPDGWKFGTSSKTNTNAEIITATLKTAENIDLTENYGEGVISVNAATITAGVEIIANDLNNSIKGSKGADIISGGAGNDTVSLGGGDDIYIYSGGNDVIQDYVATHDSIQIEIDDIENISVETVGSDVIYTTSEGTLKVAKGKGKDIVLMDENGDQIIFDAVKIPAGWQLDSAKNLLKATVASADNEIDLSEAYGDGVTKVDGSKITAGVQILGNDNENSIKGSKGADIISGGAGNDTVSLGAGDDVYVYSGGDDYISDYVAGHDSIQIEIDDIENISAETIGTNVVYTMDEGTLTVAKGSGKQITLMDSNGDIINIGSKIPAGWQLTNNILKATVASADNEIDLSEAYGDGVTKVDGSKISGGVEIIGNDLNNSLKGGAGNDILAGGSGNDTLTSGTGDDLFIYTGGDDYITDYAAGKDSIQIDTSEIEIYSMETVGANVVYSTDAGNITVKSGKGKNITLIDAEGAEIVIASNAIPAGWSFDSAKKLLKATVASADNEIDLSEAYGDGVTKVDAMKITGGVVIIGNDEDNSLKGGKGADEISGGSGNDTVSLGGGADVYIYSGGDDVIQDYVAGTDSIQINTGDIEVEKVSTVGNDIVYETSAGNLKVVKGKGKEITLMDENGAEIIIGGVEYPEGWTFDSSKNLLRATISSAVDEIDLSENYGAGVEKVDGSKITSGVVIYGSDDNISMKGSKSADTISGGTGNDTVSLGGGADVYIYNGGNDYIHDYANVDSIQIDTDEITINGISTVSTNKIIETSEGNITLKSGKTKTLNLIDANGEEIAVSGRVAENVWFLEDDNNFVASDIDSITENKFAVTEIQNTKVEELSQPVLTFAEEK